MKFRRQHRRTAKLGRLVRLILLLVFIFGLVFLFFGSGLFSIQKIETASVSCVSSEEIIKTANALGHNFFFLNPQNISKRIREKFFCLGNIKVHKNFPNSLKIEFEERKAVAIVSSIKYQVSSISTESAILATQPASPELQRGESALPEKYFLIDESGEVYSEIATTSAKLPLLQTSEDLKIGQKINSQLLKSTLKILKFLPQINTSANWVQIENKKGEIYLLLKDGPPIFFSGTKDIQFQLTSLQLILTRTRIEGRKLVKIDLRFEKPIIQ